MKILKEIIGLRIISVASGTQVGHIKDYMINPQGGSLDFFVVDQDSTYFGARVISIADIFGIGEFAMTIPDPNVIQDVAHNQAAQELIKQNVRVVGSKVLTKKGDLIGEVKEIAINEETGTIETCFFEDNQGEEREIGAGKVITYGQELLIVDKNLDVSSDEMVQSLTSSSELSDNPVLDESEAFFSPEIEELNIFEQRQLQFFVGKSVATDITLDNGEVLLASMPMTEETVNKIKSRSTMLRVTTNLIKN